MMRALHTMSVATRDASGAVLVFVALTLPALILAGGLVVDVGNWFAHKRHLQVQADAGALAGAGKFRYPLAVCPNGDIRSTAAQYASVPFAGATYSAPGLNPQLGGTASGNLPGLINSKNFPASQTTPNDDTVEKDPCEARMIDVKLTETDLPWFLKAAQVKYINAQARVEIRRLTVGKKFVPIGVPNVAPKKIRAFFVDEGKAPGDAGYEIASTDLEASGASGSLALYSNINPKDAATGLPEGVLTNITASRIGLRIALGDSSTPLTGDYATVCAIALVHCYDPGTADGLVNIRGWTNDDGTSLTAPHVRDVQLLNGSCADGYFNNVADTTSCAIGVRATVGFGAGTYGPNKPKPANTKLQARMGGTLYDLAYDVATGTWSSSALAVDDDDDGPLAIDLVWSTGCNNALNNCSTVVTFNEVQRTFEGSDVLSGPIQRAVITTATGGPGNSFQIGSSPRLLVTIGLSGNLAVAQSVSDPKVILKAEQGGLTGFLDCDPNIAKVEDELFSGCGPSYTINTGNGCPYVSDPLQCVPVEPGNKVGHVGPGLNERILGAKNPGNQLADCTSRNNWSKYATPEGLPAGDPRVIQVFIVPLGSFEGTLTGKSVPILDIATFYVTGWQGVGAASNPCQQTGGGDDSAQRGEIVGHFIKYIDLNNAGGGTEELCDPDSLAPCVAAFTR